jgi:hypothetical protein
MAPLRAADDVAALLASRTVDLTVEERAGVARKAWPVTQGVPFARNSLADVTQLRLTDDTGQPVALAARPIAWWDQEKTWIRFALLDFQAGVGTKTKRVYRLDWQGIVKAARPAIAQPVQVVDAGDSITITSGTLRAAFSKTQPLLWREVSFGGRPYLNPREAGTFFVTRQNGQRFAMACAKQGYKVEIEEASPLRVVVKQSGLCASADGAKTYCRYVIRHCFYAGKPWIHLRPTLIFTGDWPNEWLKDFGLDLKLPWLITQAITGTDGRKISQAVTNAGLLALQKEDDAFSVSSGGRELAAGKQGDGFLSASGLTIAVRDFWQTHPKAFAVGGDTVTIKLWAEESGRELDFDRHWVTRPMVKMSDLPGAVVDKQVGGYTKAFDEGGLRAALQKLAPGTLVNLRMGAGGGQMAFLPFELFDRIYAESKDKLFFFGCDYYPLHPLETARGHGKTHDLLLTFDPQAGVRDALAWQKPLYAIPSASYSCGTEAVAKLRPREPGRFPLFDDALMKSAAQAMTTADRWRINGMLHFGSTLSWHNQPGVEFIMRAMGKEPGFRPHERIGFADHGHTLPGGGIQKGAWLMFCYTADPAWLEFALRKTGHLMDVARCQEEFGTGGRRSRGFLGGGDAGTHWQSTDVPMHGYDGIMFHYLFTGDPVALEAAREISERTIAEHQDRWGPNHRTYVYAYTARGWYISGASLLEYYRLTWDPQAVATVGQIWQQLQTRPQRGLPVFDRMYAHDFAAMLYDLRPDEAVKRGIIEMADALVDKPFRANDATHLETRTLALAYDLTGNRKYLGLAEQRLKETNLPYLTSQAYDGLGVTCWPGVAASSLPWIFPALHKAGTAGAGAARP